MIQIHRSQPFVFVEEKRVKLTPAEHRLLTTLGIMDNRVVDHQLLLRSVCDHPVLTPDDRKVLQIHVSRLRKKLGSGVLRNARKLGYQLCAPVEFVG